MTQRDNLIGRTLRLSALAAWTVSVSAMPGQARPTAIPATAPTQSVSDLPSAHPAVTESTPRGNSRIVWNGANLTVDAGGNALPEILQQIARKTGMKITGGVPDERVFGTYGPGPVQVVMGQLFDGLAINMMLMNGSATAPKELVLTSRSGAASPPQVRQVSGDDDRSRLPADATMPFGQRPGRNFGPQQPRGQGPAGPGGPPPNGDMNGDPLAMPARNAAAAPEDGAAANNDGTGDGTTGGGDSNTTPSAGADQQEPANGIRTPEQIFEQLRQRQQQTTPTQ